MKELKEAENKILWECLGKMAIVMTIFSVILTLLGLNRATSISDKMTKQVISLYENLAETETKKGQKKAKAFKYVPASKELNELNLAYNNFAKILNLAST